MYTGFVILIDELTMNRRSTIKYLAAGGVVAVMGGSYHWLTKQRDHSNLALDSAIQRLTVLELGSIETTGTWEVARTFNHLAQSVEFSMEGFPEMKSALFQNTAGSLAFSVFQANGRMTHGLDEPIPGEIVERSDADAPKALNRLIQALERFHSYEDPLMPHFAYGNLNKTQYSLAHVMHINNHLEEFRNS